MLLAIDAGNTNIVMAVYDGEAQLCFERTETDDGFLSVFEKLKNQYPDIQSIIVSSVVPNVNAAIQENSKTVFSVEPVFVDHKSIGVDVDVDHPNEVGADRLVNAVAVIEQYKKPAIIIDFGTATTFDVIDEAGRYCGGVIAPGINLSLEALHNAAAQLPDVPIKKPDTVIGKNTIHAMQSGLYWGYIGMIEGTLKRLAEEMANDGQSAPYIIATGGLAPLFAEGTNVIETTDENLTMKGLVAIHNVRMQKEQQCA